jgi:hypothetical protein
MTSPKSWKKYLAHAKPSADPRIAQFSRFAARYSIASQLEGVSMSSSSEAKNDAYTQLLKVMLAYSALEALETALGAKSQIKVTAPQITKVLRDAKNLWLLKVLEDSIERNSKNLNLFQQFVAHESDNLRPAVYAIRNLMAHGTLSASRLRLLNSKQRRQLFCDLSEATLNAADLRFTEYVKKIGG